MATDRCSWCERTDTERQSAPLFLGDGAEVCVDDDDCIQAHILLVAKVLERLKERGGRP